MDGAQLAGGSGKPTSDLRARRQRFRLQCLFISRLGRLMDLREKCVAARDSERAKLLDHVLYSTYWDCVSLGLRAQARCLLRLDSDAR
jgi:hypothetical protein